MKPAVWVQGASRRFSLPMDTCSEVEALHERLMEELGEASAVELFQEDGSAVKSKRVQPASTLLLVRKGETLDDAKRGLETAKKTEAENAAARVKKFQEAEEARKKARRSLPAPA